MQHLCNGQGGVSLYLCIVKMRQVAGALVLHNKARVARHTLSPLTNTKTQRNYDTHD